MPGPLSTFLESSTFQQMFDFTTHKQPFRRLFVTSLVLKIQYTPLPIDNSNFRLHLCQGGGWLNITTGPPVCQGHFLHPPGGSYFPTPPGRASARNYIFRSSRGHVHCRSLPGAIYPLLLHVQGPRSFLPVIYSSRCCL